MVPKRHTAAGGDADEDRGVEDDCSCGDAAGTGGVRLQSGVGRGRKACAVSVARGRTGVEFPLLRQHQRLDAAGRQRTGGVDEARRGLAACAAGSVLRSGVRPGDCPDQPDEPGPCALRQGHRAGRRFDAAALPHPRDPPARCQGVARIGKGIARGAGAGARSRILMQVRARICRRSLERRRRKSPRSSFQRTLESTLLFAYPANAVPVLLFTRPDSIRMDASPCGLLKSATGLFAGMTAAVAARLATGASSIPR